MKNKHSFIRSASCGGTIAVLCTAIAAANVLPPALSTVEVASAVSGLLSALASAYGLCQHFPAGNRSPEDPDGGVS